MGCTVRHMGGTVTLNVIAVMVWSGGSHQDAVRGDQVWWGLYSMKAGALMPAAAACVI